MTPWIPWVLFTVVLLYAIVLSVVHLYRHFFPFPDQGSWIFVCPSLEARAALVNLFQYYGVDPRFQHDTDTVKRAIFWDGTILNVTAPALHEQMDRASAGRALVVKDPIEAAVCTRAYLEWRGFSARVLLDPDPEMPKGSLAFVISNVTSGWAIVFRKHITKLGPTPPAWAGVQEGLRYGLS